MSPLSSIGHLGCVCFDFKSLPEMLFHKCGCLVVHEKWIFRKRILVDRKIKAFDPENIFSQNFTFKSFLETRKERKREKKDSRANTERERSRTQKTQDRRTTGKSHYEPTNPRTRDHCTVNPWTASRTAPIAPWTHESQVAPRTRELPISFSFSFEIFVIKFVCDFDFLLSLFDLWFFCCCCGGVGGGVLVVFLLCGGGFCVGGGGK